MLQPDVDDAGSVTASCAAPIRCAVVYTSMSQCGHFMMGFARIGGQRITLSGAYGGDGLPRSVPMSIYKHKRTVELPAELREAWNKGGGWNGAGNEAGAIQEWAKRTFAGA